MLKITEIAKAWIASYNPTSEQKSIAEYRISVCQKCPNMGYIKAADIHICRLCGCPLNKKIFSPLPGQESCPDKQWVK